MEIVKTSGKGGPARKIEPEPLVPGVTDRDRRELVRITSTELSDEQKGRILTPERTYPRETLLFALHWHPEFIPMQLIRSRIEAMYPAREDELVIPTQHNEFMTYDSVYWGAELDCYSRGFNQKVQLLIHLRGERLERADVLKSMAAYTFKYRSGQLFALMDAFVKPCQRKLDRAARETGADGDIVMFVCTAVGKVHGMLHETSTKVPGPMIKNQILRNFMDTYRTEYGNSFVNRAQAFLKSVKEQVKDEFPTHYFYRTSEVIEEARSLGAGIVIPHPEQFWPILLAGYDVDGIEVWNPQSRRYTEFLISIIAGRNESLGKDRRKLLILMGDDTHMSEKIKDPQEQTPEKARREVGLQEPWHEMDVRKKLILARMKKRDMMREYRSRIS